MLLLKLVFSIINRKEKTTYLRLLSTFKRRRKRLTKTRVSVLVVKPCLLGYTCAWTYKRLDTHSVKTLENFSKRKTLLKTSVILSSLRLVAISKVKWLTSLVNLKCSPWKYLLLVALLMLWIRALSKAPNLSLWLHHPSVTRNQLKSFIWPNPMTNYPDRCSLRQLEKSLSITPFKLVRWEDLLISLLQEV